MNLSIDFYEKTVLEYTTNTYQEDIPKQFLQEAKIRLNSFFSEQECVQKKGFNLYSNMHSTQ